jgi:hypothetical protein
MIIFFKRQLLFKMNVYFIFLFTNDGHDHHHIFLMYDTTRSFARLLYLQRNAHALLIATKAFAFFVAHFGHHFFGSQEATCVYLLKIIKIKLSLYLKSLFKIPASHLFSFTPIESSSSSSSSSLWQLTLNNYSTYHRPRL